MDGYEATAHIRRWEAGTRHTPIIAMTAAATEGDRERCLSVGMDDYITKPVRPDVIAAVIERWVPTSHVVPVAARPTAPFSAASSDDAENDVLDTVQIGLLRSLDDGEGSVLAEIVSQYLDQSLVQRDTLADAVGEGDSRVVERVAHSLHGSSANVGAATLAQICGELETLARGGNVTGAAKLMEVLDGELARVCGALAQIVVRV
jgi:CheY-like chemotaxis protein